MIIWNILEKGTEKEILPLKRHLLLRNNNGIRNRICTIRSEIQLLNNTVFICVLYRWGGGVEMIHRKGKENMASKRIICPGIRQLRLNSVQIKKTCSLLNYYSLKGIFRQQNFLSRLSLMVLRSNPSQFVIIKSVHF